MIAEDHEYIIPQRRKGMKPECRKLSAVRWHLPDSSSSDSAHFVLKSWSQDYVLPSGVYWTCVADVFLSKPALSPVVIPVGCGEKLLYNLLFPRVCAKPWAGRQPGTPWKLHPLLWSPPTHGQFERPLLAAGKGTCSPDSEWTPIKSEGHSVFKSHFLPLRFHCFWNNWKFGNVTVPNVPSITASLNGQFYYPSNYSRSAIKWIRSIWFTFENSFFEGIQCVFIAHNSHCCNRNGIKTDNQIGLKINVDSLAGYLEFLFWLLSYPLGKHQRIP